MPAIRIVIVDDEELVRTALRTVLDSVDGIEVAAECDSPAALTAVEVERPTLVLLDSVMPHPDGLTVLRELRRRSDPPAVAMLTSFQDREMAALALAGGARGLLLKDTAPQLLVASVRLIAAGSMVLAPGAEPDSFSTAVSNWDKELTPRERDVLTLLTQGLPNSSIASRLGLARATVKEHVSNVLRKLGAPNRAAAAAIAVAQRHERQS